ncbi:MAG: rod shape-determining protein MreC [Lautropia sp.]|nr:rod shape-determining protein MreC [Lautropia sp.]
MKYRRPPSTNHPHTGLGIVLLIAALALMVTDARLQRLDPVRQLIATALSPVQQVLAQPRALIQTGLTYVSDIHALRQRNEVLRQALTRQSKVLAQTEALQQENQQLRALAGLKPHIPTPSLVAEVLMQPRSAGNQQRLLNKGSQHGVAVGQPVLDPNGVIGQITRVYPHSSEMTLMTDSAISVPVTVKRNGLHAIVFGNSTPNRMALRFQTDEADLRQGDLLYTSGLDFLYPRGLPVGVIEQIDKKATEPFADISVRPLADTRHPTLVLVLLSNTVPADGAPADAATEQAAAPQP